MFLSEIKKLNEEALDTKKAEDLWTENEADAAEYTSNTTYLVRKMKDADPPEYEVFSVKGSSRKAYGTFTPGELAAALTPIRPNQTPDAEGFITYLEKDKTEAIQYNGEPIKVITGPAGGARLMKGDYLIRTNNGNDFEYSTETGSNFEATMQKV